MLTDAEASIEVAKLRPSLHSCDFTATTVSCFATFAVGMAIPFEITLTCSCVSFLSGMLISVRATSSSVASDGLTLNRFLVVPPMET